MPARAGQKPKPAPMRMLTKTDFTRFLQCGKYLWLSKFKKELALPPDEHMKRIFEQGHEVEAFADELFKGGVCVEADDIFDAERESRALVEKGCKTIFHATAIAKATKSAAKPQLMAEADIIKYNPKAKAWDLYEVKSTNSVQDKHIPDVCFQKITFQKAGYKINKTYLVHLNREFVKNGPIDPEKLIMKEDISDRVKEMELSVEKNIPFALAVLQEQEEVHVRIVKQCRNPNDCLFIPHCWRDVPKYSVYELTSIKEAKLVELLDKGIVKIKDVPGDFPLSRYQSLQVKAVKTREPVIEKEKFRKALKSLKYPLYFLDYETFGSAIPVWDGTKPHQQIPFQYSLHVARGPEDLMLGEKELEHNEFLARGKENPMPALLKQLKRDMDTNKGTVLVWNKGFEMDKNRKMAALYPRYKSFLESVNERVFDLMGPFKSRLFVDKDFEGTCSLKYVLPVLGGGVSYEDLEISEGSDVGRQWYLTNFGGLPEAEIKRIRRMLLEYCGRDTYAIVRVLRTVKKMVE